MAKILQTLQAGQPQCKEATTIAPTIGTIAPTVAPTTIAPTYVRVTNLKKRKIVKINFFISDICSELLTREYKFLNILFYTLKFLRYSVGHQG